MRNKLFLTAILLSSIEAQALPYGVIPTVAKEVPYWQQFGAKTDPHWLTRYDGLIGKKENNYLVRCGDNNNHGTLMIVVKTMSRPEWFGVSINDQADPGSHAAGIGKGEFRVTKYSNAPWHQIPTYIVTVGKGTKTKMNYKINFMCGSNNSIYTKSHQTVKKL